LTDVQFAEMRYSGKPAAFLRGFRAVYLGLLMNCLILGWVTKAMTSIVATTLGVSDHRALAICVLFLIPFTGLYVALGGLWGVLWTDLFQFALKMSIVIGVAWYAVSAAGGMRSLLHKLAEMRAAAGPSAGDAAAFFPDFSRPWSQERLWLLPVLTFVVYIGVQWWAFWYPGAEPGGGGYIAQRIFSAKDERNGFLSQVHQARRRRQALRDDVPCIDGSVGDCFRPCFRALGGYPFRLAGCIGSRRRHRRRLSPALVLVADQRLERNLGNGHGFGHDDLPALGGAILGLEHSCIRQDCSNHECSYNVGLVDRHLCH